MWKTDDEFFALMREKLLPAVVGDVLDTLGFPKQFLHPQNRPLKSEMVVIGRAMPVLASNAFSARQAQGQGPRGKLVDWRVAVEIVSTQNPMRLAIERGMSTVEAFKTFGVR